MDPQSSSKINFVSSSRKSEQAEISYLNGSSSKQAIEVSAANSQQSGPRFTPCFTNATNQERKEFRSELLIGTN